MYTYHAEVTNVVDGDTLDVIIDLGFYVKITQRVRLAGINTPEIRGEERPAGLASREYVVAWVARYGGHVKLESSKPQAGDKYGRFLATVLSLEGESLNQLLLEEGLAEAYSGSVTAPP